MRAGQPCGHGVGVARGLQPQIVLEIGVELRGDEARLRKELCRALADEGEFARPGRGRTGRPPRRTSSRSWCRRRRAMSTPRFQVISAGVASSDDQRIGEARAVHVQRQAVRLGDRRDRLDLVEAIDRADLGRLGDRDRDRAAGVDECRPRSGRSRASRLSGSMRPSAPSTGAEPRAAGEIFRRAAFVVDDMRLAVAEGRCRPACWQRDQRQRIRRRAGADEEDRDLALEDLAELLLRPPCRVRRCRRRASKPPMRVPRDWRRSSDGRRPNCRMQRSRVLIPLRVEVGATMTGFFAADFKGQAAGNRAPGDCSAEPGRDRRLRDAAAAA